MTDPAEPIATAEPTEITIKRFLCRHIHTSGSRCGSPALRGESFCYYHHTTRRPAPRHRGVHPEHAIFELPAIDDRAGVQFALAQVLARVATDQLDHKRSGRLLHGLFIASRNLLHGPRSASISRTASRGSRHSRLDSAGSASAGNSNHPDDIVEELVRDSDLGPIAPIAELPPPQDPAAAAEDRRRSLASLLDDLFPPNPAPIPDPTQRAGAPSSAGGPIAGQGGVESGVDATTNPQPATLPTLQAAAPSAPFANWVPHSCAFVAHEWESSSPPAPRIIEPCPSNPCASSPMPTSPPAGDTSASSASRASSPLPTPPTPPTPPRRVETAIALVMGDLTAPPPPIVRIHSQCLTGDVFHSLRCDCRQQLELALAAIAAAGRGILIYESKEGRGIGLMAKLQAYQLQDQGLDTVEANLSLGFQADCRQYELPAAILTLLGVPSVRLITNNPEKVAALESVGIRVAERISAQVPPNPPPPATSRPSRKNGPPRQLDLPSGNWHRTHGSTHCLQPSGRFLGLYVTSASIFCTTLS